MSIDRLSLDSDRRTVRTVLAMLVLPTIWFFRTDLALMSTGYPHVRLRIAFRAVLVLACLAGLLLMRRERTRDAYSRIMFVLAMTITMFLVAINSLRPQGSTLPLRTPMLTLAAAYGGLPNTFWRQIIPPIVATVGLIILRLTWVTSGADGDRPGDIVAIVMVNMIGILIVQRRLALEHQASVAWSAEHDARLASELALKELNTLRGIIPICSHCKNVRTDVGEWERVEWYVADHSDAEFSHGVCPDCEKKYYAEHR